jgi:hypothetical protein
MVFTKRRVIALLAGLAAVFLVVSPTSAGAATAPPVSVSFDVSLVFTNPPDHPPCTPTALCTAAGAFANASAPMCPSGTALDVYVFNGRPRDRTYICADGSGTLTMNVQ